MYFGTVVATLVNIHRKEGAQPIKWSDVFVSKAQAREWETAENIDAKLLMMWQHGAARKKVHGIR